VKRSDPPITGRHLVIVHSVDSGLLPAAAAWWRRLSSPTPPCAICALTRGVRGVNPRWQTFLDSLSEPVHSLNRDQFRTAHAPSYWRAIALPAILVQTGSQIDRVVSAPDILRAQNVRELIAKVEEGLAQHPPEPSPTGERSAGEPETPPAS
jgi:hypothetical protein